MSDYDQKVRRLAEAERQRLYYEAIEHRKVQQKIVRETRLAGRDTTIIAQLEAEHAKLREEGVPKSIIIAKLARFRRRIAANLADIEGLTQKAIGVKLAVSSGRVSELLAEYDREVRRGFEDPVEKLRASQTP